MTLGANLTVGAGADKRGRMGRPPLKRDIKTRATMVRLTEDVRSRIEAIVGPNRMAAFIREAIDAELKRRESAHAGPSDTDRSPTD